LRTLSLTAITTLTFQNELVTKFSSEHLKSVFRIQIYTLQIWWICTPSGDAGHNIECCL